MSERFVPEQTEAGALGAHAPASTSDQRTQGAYTAMATQAKTAAAPWRDRPRHLRDAAELADAAVETLAETNTSEAPTT
jgi:hypothetical protein